MKTGLLITARLKSSRFPLKLLLRLQGREVVRHVIDRAKTVFGIDEIVLCTSSDPQDRPLVDIARQEGIHYFMGDDVDVLKRLRDAAIFFGIDGIVSITADNPLFCVYHANRVADFWRKNPQTDYIYLDTLPIGSAVYGLRTKALEVVCDFKKDADTEIWGAWLNHPEIFKVTPLVPEDFWRFDARLTLDNPEDLLFMQTLLERANVPLAHLGLQELKMLVQAYPELQSINAHIVQRVLDAGHIENIKNSYNEYRGTLRQKLGHV